MSKIETFAFDKNQFDKIKEYKFGKNWPVVYLIEGEIGGRKEIYIGQTVSAYYRSNQHFKNPERNKLKEIHILSDEEFNVSAALDVESWLIQYISADGKYILQNGNSGLKNHNYYNRPMYKSKFEHAWNELIKRKIVSNSLLDLKNSDLFKYSPYKTLNEDQLRVAKEIYKEIKNSQEGTFIIHGKPGTGKTILATYLVKFLKEKESTKNLNIGLVIPMVPLRNTISKVFRKIKGLRSSMVIGPNSVIKDEYDILIVDEAHRLQRRKGIMGMGAFDKVSRFLGFDKNKTHLDWIMKRSKYRIFFYDENQSVKPADIRAEDFQNIKAKHYTLETQMRVEAGEEFLKLMDNIFELKHPQKTVLENYDFRVTESIHQLQTLIKEKDKEHKLSRMISGYAWPWHTKANSKSKQAYDIEIDGLKLIWNSTTKDWVNSKNAVDEVGCIHTIQGYDLNYVGVIIGPEFYYDKHENKFKVDRTKYFDTNGRNGITDPNELEFYIKNIYKTLLTRGIKGAYVYIVDENLRNYFKEWFNKIQFKNSKEWEVEFTDNRKREENKNTILK